MFKQRLWIWFLCFAIMWGGKYLIDWIATPQPEINIEYSIADNPELSNVRNVNISGIKEIYNVKNPQVILTNKEINDKEFKKYDNILMSPLVLYTGDHALIDGSGFNITNPSDTFSYRKGTKDLSTILLGIEKNKTWQDIGIVDSCLKGKIHLHIPNKDNYLYQYVKELFLINLGEQVTEENIDALMARVNNILSKCTHVEDLESFIVNLENDDKNDLKVAVIAPEYLMANHYSTFYGEHSSSKQKFFVPIYPTKTVSLNYHLYIKNDVNENIKDKIVDKYSSKKILTETGLRPLYANVKVASLNSLCITDVNLVTLTNNLKEKVVTYKPTISDSAVSVESETVQDENTENTTEENNTEDEEGLSGFHIFLIVLMCVLGLAVIIMFAWMSFSY